MDLPNPILIFCDGACSGNPGPGGWGAIVAVPQGNVRELGGGAPATTNNQMELTAATEALKTIASSSGVAIVHTDSTYVIRGITEWIWSWFRRGWISSEGKAVANREFWESLHAVVTARGKGGVVWKYVAGHAGIPGNDRADAIAVAFSKGETISLFSGARAQYAIDLDRTVAEAGAARTGKSRKGQAYSYLSLLGGIPMRHSSWAECETRVKGKANAKFKKAMSQNEEREILRSWGIAPKAL